MVASIEFDDRRAVPGLQARMVLAEHPILDATYCTTKA
jgi:hypothetical protein